jgi:hypothetical protein
MQIQELNVYAFEDALILNIPKPEDRGIDSQ